MSIAVLFDCSADSLAQYDQCLELCPELADQPARPYHMCMPSGTGFLVIDVWESPEAFARFGEVLGRRSARSTCSQRRMSARSTGSSRGNRPAPPGEFPPGPAPPGSAPAASASAHPDSPGQARRGKTATGSPDDSHRGAELADMCTSTEPDGPTEHSKYSALSACLLYSVRYGT